jgi:hypothetical protein
MAKSSESNKGGSSKGKGNGGKEGSSKKGEAKGGHPDDPEGMAMKKRDRRIIKLIGGIRKKLSKIATLCGGKLRYLTIVETMAGEMLATCSPSLVSFLHGPNGFRSLFMKPPPASSENSDDPTVRVGQALKSLTRHTLRALWAALGWNNLVRSYLKDGLPESLEELEGMVLDFGPKGNDKFEQRDIEQRVNLVMGKGWQKPEDVAGLDYKNNPRFISLQTLLSLSSSKLSDKYSALVIEAGIGVVMQWCHRGEYNHPLSYISLVVEGANLRYRQTQLCGHNQSCFLACPCFSRSQL